MPSSKSSPQYKALISELRNEIAAGNFTQKELGDELNLKQSSVSELLSGKSNLSMDQFLKICDILAISPHNILRKAEVKNTGKINATPEMEKTMYKSHIHVLCYCASSQVVGVEDIHLHRTPKTKIKEAFDELVEVGLLKKIALKYVQRDPNLVIAPSNREQFTMIHLEIMNRTYKMFEELKKSNSFTTPKFRFFQIDRFSYSQIKDIESDLYKLYDKVSRYMIQNQSKSYSSSEKLILWNIHMMSMPVLDAPHV